MTTFRHRPALDGLRGAAVIGVVMYHFDLLPGGYLGVDLFFVLSGFLITSLLIDEHKRTATISLSGFWTRRARRLLPASLTLIAAAALYAKFLGTGPQIAQIRSDALSGLLYVNNWTQIHGGVGYWDKFTVPSVLRHLWSLSIEEQFYFAWPLAVMGILTATKSSVRALGAIAAAGAATSTLWAIYLFHIGADPTRIYFGSDTRVGAILMGVFVASLSAVAAERPPALAGQTRALIATATTLVSCTALAALWYGMHGDSPALWRGGMAFAGILAATLIGTLASQRPGPLGVVFSSPVLRWFGSISYGFYLWHWPVRVFFDQSRFQWNVWSLNAARTVVSIGLAAISYYLVEMPIRQRRFVPKPSLSFAGIGVVVAVVLIGTTAPPDSSRSLLATLDSSNAEQTTDPVLPPNTKPRVAIFGDSVGAGVGQGMDALALRHGFSSQNRAQVACPLIIGQTPRREYTGKVVNEDDRCTHIIEEIDRSAIDKPNLIVFVFGTNGDAGRLMPSGAYSDPCEPDFDAWRKQTWETVIRRAQRTGAKVAVTTAGYSRAYGAPVQDAPITDCMNAATVAAAKATGARVVDIKAWVCPTIACDRLYQHKWLRSDGLHFSDAAEPVAAAFILDHLVVGWRSDNPKG